MGSSILDTSKAKNNLFPPNHFGQSSRSKVRNKHRMDLARKANQADHLQNIQAQFIREQYFVSSMENIVKGDGGNAEKKSSPNIIYEELKPSSDWAEYSDGHCLLVDLPGFNKEQVRLQADQKSRLVKISGERKEKENKYIRFEQSYKVPENSNVEETIANFEDEILYVIIPLKTRESKEGHGISSSSSDDEDDSQSSESSWDEDLHEDNDQSKDNDEGSSYNSENKGVLEEEEQFHDTKQPFEEEEEEFHDRKQSYEGNILEEVKKRLMKNKKTIITAVLAFSLGVIFSQKLQSDGQRMSFK